MNKKSEDLQSWIDNYSLSLLNRAIYLLSNREDAEDMVQDVFIAAFEYYDSFRGESHPKTWLMNILKYKVADYYRKKYKSTGKIKLDHFFDASGQWKDDSVIGEWQDDQELLLDDAIFRTTLTHCLDNLPAKWLIPVKLYYLEEKKATIVCQETGISTTNLWKILQRSRLQLRACLESNWLKTN